MRSDPGDSQLEPTVLLLSDVLEDVARGRLRVPAFQRPFVWRPDQMLDLFDSIERGYPIGSILLWETSEDVASLSAIGEVDVPRAPIDRPVSYVLDGHQRLSTLFGALRRPGGRSPSADDQREWKWRIYRDLEPRTENERYRHYRGTDYRPAPPDNFLPIRAVNTTRDFLQFSRRLDLAVQDRDRLDRLFDEAENVAQRIRGYKVTLIRLRGGELGQAVEVYTRLNRRGVRMDADQVVSALTHRPGQPTLASRIDEIVGSVAGTGFGELPRLAVFRSVLAIADEPDVMTPRWERVAGRMQNRLVDAVPATEQAVHAAVKFLQWAGLPLAHLLPYAHQLVVLAKFFHHCPNPSDRQRHELRRWFWVTSWAGSFAGANSTTLRQALHEIRKFGQEGGELALDLANVQPIPEQFYLNSARTLAYIAWETNALPKRLDALGQEFDVVQSLAPGLAQAYRPVIAKDSRPANRLVFPTVAGTSVGQALENLAVDGELFGDLFDDLPDGPYSPAWARMILESHGIPVNAWHRLKEGHGDVFVDERAAFLESRLREFARSIGVPLGDGLVGVADDDTE
jgi:hypothetical protein